MPTSSTAGVVIRSAGKLIVFRGLPASGKTTEALRLRSKLLQDGVVAARISRDGLRDLLHGDRSQEREQEDQVSIAGHAAVEGLLAAGRTVIVDDTNLSAEATRVWVAMIARTGAELAVNDECLAVSVEECIQRDNLRRIAGHPWVGEDAIRGMHERYLVQRKGKLALPKLVSMPPAQPYVPKPGAPDIVMVDIDGTVALRGDRSPFDMTRVSEDLPNPGVIAAVRAMYAAGFPIVFCSGRDETARADTTAWLTKHVGVPSLGLYMRAKGDGRTDAEVKREIFDREIRDRCTVVGVFDDREQVVRMWRSLGLTVFQVDEGKF
ncbi:AAA family ATPase [Micromonospora maritima]|uniref:phosphatase domain-containing protein n=1 Tax=Micromonospora maritima TaxID=986711 RepID=UPI001FEA3ACF|nr:AAA family ATPase [Micromonospora maritima]